MAYRLRLHYFTPLGRSKSLWSTHCQLFDQVTFKSVVYRRQLSERVGRGGSTSTHILHYLTKNRNVRQTQHDESEKGASTESPPSDGAGSGRPTPMRYIYHPDMYPFCIDDRLRE